MKAGISVVIPVYNRADVVTAALDSIAAQTVRPAALILVDNNSSDNTPQVLTRWAESNSSADFPVTVLSEPRPGACAARNRGLAAVDTEWVLFFDSDDTMRPRHIERALEVAAANPEADVVGWDMLRHHHDGSTERLSFIGRDMVYNNITHSTFSTLMYMARTSVVRRAGGWDESTRMFDDCELGNRILALNPKLVYASGEVTVDVHVSDESISTRSHVGRLDCMAPAMDGLRRNLPAQCHHWVDLHQLTMTATWARRDPKAPALAREILRRQPLGRRLLFNALYIYARLGGRGVARIYRLLTSLKLYY